MVTTVTSAGLIGDLSYWEFAFSLASVVIAIVAILLALWTGKVAQDTASSAREAAERAATAVNLMLDRMLDHIFGNRVGERAAESAQHRADSEMKAAITKAAKAAAATAATNSENPAAVANHLEELMDEVLEKSQSLQKTERAESLKMLLIDLIKRALDEGHPVTFREINARALGAFTNSEIQDQLRYLVDSGRIKCEGRFGPAAVIKELNPSS